MFVSKLVNVGRILVLSMALLGVVASQGGCESKGKIEEIGFPRSFADLAEKVKPAVVNISTTSTVKVPGNPFHQFFGPMTREGRLVIFSKTISTMCRTGK